MRRQQELEAIILSADSDNLPMEAEAKKQELKNSKATIDELTQQLKGWCLIPISCISLFYNSCSYLTGSHLPTAVVENIDSLTKKTREIRNSKEKLKVHATIYRCCICGFYSYHLYLWVHADT